MASTHDSLLVMDVANATFKNPTTGKIISTATTSATSVAQTLTEDVLRAGWGGGVVATISSERNVEISVSDVLFSMDYLSMTTGSDIEDNATGTVLDSFTATIVDNAGNLEVPVPTGVTATEGILVDKDGEQEPVTITGSVIEVPTGAVAVAGDEVTVFYEKQITGQKVTIDSQKFPQYVELLLHTRAFNPDTNEVVKDIYIQFDKVKPSGAFNFDLAVNSPVTTELVFTALNKSQNSTEMGRYWSVDR